MEGMETEATSAARSASAPRPASFHAGQLLLWLPVCAALGLAVAWGAVIAERYFAPLVFFPLLVGVVLGGACVALLRLLHVGHRPTIVCGGVIAVVAALIGQHYFGFLRSQWQPPQDPKQAMRQALFPDRVPPPQFGDYLQWRAQQGVAIGAHRLRGASVWLLWAVDGLLVAAPALALLILTARLPYCDECRRWYEPIRGRKVDRATAERLASLAGIELPPEARAFRFRLLACPAGCGPAGLALFWEQPDGDFSSDYVWLESPQREQVLETIRERRAKKRRQPPGSDGTP